MNQYKYQVRFTNLPGGPDNPAEFIETETVDGKGVGSDHGFFWKNDGDTVLLMIPNGQWNNAKDILPEGNIEVVVITTMGNCRLAYYDLDVEVWYDDGWALDVAYWMMPPTLEDLNEPVE